MLTRSTLACVAAAFLIAAGEVSAQPFETPNGYSISRSVIAGGGGMSQASNGFTLNGTIGQPIATISTAANGLTLTGGFHIMQRPSAAAVRHWNLY